MFVRVSQDFTTTLEDKQDFKHFKLVVDAPRGEAAKIRAALAGIASLDEDGHAWVSESWLRRCDAAPQWQDGLSAMIAVAKKYGWVDEQKKAVRAHVEWPGEAPGRG